MPRRLHVPRLLVNEQNTPWSVPTTAALFAFSGRYSTDSRLPNPERLPLMSVQFVPALPVKKTWSESITKTRRQSFVSRTRSRTVPPPAGRAAACVTGPPAVGQNRTLVPEPYTTTSGAGTPLSRPPYASAPPLRRL